MELTQERLKEVLHYDPETGVFTWKIKPDNPNSVGEVAGVNVGGFIVIRFGKKLYQAHHLAFLFMEGEFPGKGMHCEYINHNRTDNRWENLRIISKQDNSMGK